MSIRPFRSAALALAFLALTAFEGKAITLQPIADSGRSGETIHVDIAMTNLFPASIATFGLTLVYNTTCLDWTGLAETSSPLGGVITGATEGTPGEVVITGTASPAIVTDGVLVKMHFSVICDSPGNTYNLSIKTLVGNLVGATTSGGSFKCGSIPSKMNYQGRLTDSGDQPINGAVNMTFRIYEASTGGTAIWTETHAGVTVNDGVFSVILGETEHLGIAFDQPYWLSVQVGSDAEMTSRQPLSSVAYAYQAEVANFALNASLLAPPVGSIIAWAKSLTGVPALPANYVECNGQTLSDATSPLNGQVIPSLNSTNRFLRGNTTSGATGGAATHTHTYQGAGSGGGTGGGLTTVSNLPPCYDVVWIMRVK